MSTLTVILSASDGQYRLDLRALPTVHIRHEITGCAGFGLSNHSGRLMYVNTVMIPHPKVTIAVHWLSCESRGKFRKPTLVDEEDGENGEDEEKRGDSGGSEGQLNIRGKGKHVQVLLHNHDSVGYAAYTRVLCSCQSCGRH